MDLIYTPVTCSRLFVISGDTIHEQPETCQDSADCPLDFCCRGQRGDIIDLSGTFDSVGITNVFVLLLLFGFLYTLNTYDFTPIMTKIMFYKR